MLKKLPLLSDTLACFYEQINRVISHSLQVYGFASVFTEF